MSEPETPTTDEQPAEEQPEERITLLESVERLAANLMVISKRTKMSETGILNLFGFQWQQIEQARQEARQFELLAQRTGGGQAAVDAIAAEVRAADEVISGDE